MKEDSRRLQKYLADVYTVVFLRSISSLPCFCPFIRSMLNRKEVLYKLFPYHLFFSDGFLTNFQIEDECVYCVGDEHFWRSGRMRLALVKRTRSKRVFKLKPSRPHTQLATNYFQTELRSRLLLTGTKLRKLAVAITLSYSPPSTLHPQVIYAIAFPAGLNGLQVDYWIRKTINGFLRTIAPRSLYCTSSVVQV